MKILITGGFGFIGQHLLKELLGRGHEILGIYRNHATPPLTDNHLQWIQYDIHSNLPIPEELCQADAVAHLAWPGLPNYNELFHIEENLYYSYYFIKNLIKAGIRHVLVAGTCQEYGMQSGELCETVATVPVVSYGISKDSLRKFLEALKSKEKFCLQWVRFFNLYGPGQRKSSLGAQIEFAIREKHASLNISPGDQIRDFLAVEEATRRVRILLEDDQQDGIFNCCTGTPKSIRNFAEEYIQQLGGKLILNLGYYPYTTYEPFAFWGSAAKTRTLFQRP